MMGKSKFGILKNILKEMKAFTLFFQKDNQLTEIVKKIEANKISYPLIAKPNVGQRGTRVEKINNEQKLIQYLKNNKGDLLIQEYINFSIELGIFYYRFPDQDKRTISSIVKKDFLKVTSDGHSSIGELIANYPRAGFQFDRLNSKLNYDTVPEKGTTIILETIGNHFRGTTFLVANTLIDQKLIDAFDTISAKMPGFFFRQYDLRCKTIEG